MTGSFKKETSEEEATVLESEVKVVLSLTGRNKSWRIAGISVPSHRKSPSNWIFQLPGGVWR